MNPKNTIDAGENMRAALAISNDYTPQAIKRMSRQLLRFSNTGENCDVYFNMIKLNPALFTQDYS